ncbi:MAG: cobalamin-binding protein [Panacagrimonas sp.]
MLPAAPAQAARVITLSPHLAELVCAAGACDQLVGVVRHSDYPEPVKNLPQVGDAVAVNAEAVLALQPDLILAWDGGTPVRIIEQLRRLGLPVQLIRVRTLEEVGLALLRVGALLGTEDAACAAEIDYRTRLLALRQRYAKSTPIRVMYQLDPDPVFTINRLSPISEAIQLCGASNVFADYTQLAGPVSREAVLATDPDAIVFGIQDDAQGIRAGWLRFAHLRAVRAGNLIAVDSNTLARATPRMAEGAEALCAALDAARARLKPLGERGS